MEIDFDQIKEKIIEEIVKRAPELKCPICNNTHLTLVDGFLAHDLQSDLNRRHIGGKNVPTIPVVCKKCGYVMEFALGTLGFLPKSEKK